VFGIHEFSFSKTDAMFARGSTAELEGFLNQVLDDVINLIPLFSAALFTGDVQVNIAVAVVAIKSE
jgi:hypothetical protein